MLGSVLAAPGLGALAADVPVPVPDTMAQRAKACVGCHGAQGRSLPTGYVPRLAGKPAGYLQAQLRAFREGRRQNETMAGLLETLDDAMLQSLAGYFSALELPYPAPASLPPAGALAQRAERLVREGDAARGVPACAGCHGERLTGIAPFVPGLLGLPQDYLVSQLGAWRSGQRHARAPDCMARIAADLTPDDISLLSQWLAAQRVPEPARPAADAPAHWPKDCGSLAP
ncbi:MAG: c-type cytochrome [Burkholderiaceae bacterium]